MAEYLTEKGFKVSVVNPLSNKEIFANQSVPGKTDKKDAKTIAEYAEKYELKKWNPESENAKKLRQLYTRIEMLRKQVHQNKRQLEAFSASGFLDKIFENEINSSVRFLETKIKSWKMK